MASSLKIIGVQHAIGSPEGVPACVRFYPAVFSELNSLEKRGYATAVRGTEVLQDAIEALKEWEIIVPINRIIGFASLEVKALTLGAIEALSGTVTQRPRRK